MQADLNKTSSPHWYCATQASDYDLWLYYTNLAPGRAGCWLDNMRLKRHEGSMVDAGIKVKLNGDRLGPEDDIEKGFSKNLWGDLLSGVADLGYSGTSPRVGALHYDWRLSLDQLMEDGTFAKMKKQVEEHVKAAGGKRAVMVTLSYGGPLMHKFLAQFVDRAWKKTYVERWVSLSGVFGGTVELTRMAFYPEAKDFYYIPDAFPYMSLTTCRDMSNTFPSSFTLRPTFMKDDEVLVSAMLGGKKHEYTKNDMALALEDSGLSSARMVYEFSQNSYSFHNLGAPGVLVDCFYGTSDNTVQGVHFGNGFNKAATKYTFEDGDGVAPTRSLSLCKRLNEDNGVPASTFPHIGHGGTLHSKVAVERFSQIIHGLYGNASAVTARESSLYV